MTVLMGDDSLCPVCALGTSLREGGLKAVLMGGGPLSHGGLPP